MIPCADTALLLFLAVSDVPTPDHVDIEAHLDPDRKHIQAAVTYTFQPHAATKELGFYLHSDVDIEEVHAPGLEEWTFRSGSSFLDQVGDRLTLHFAAPLQEGQPQTFRFRYAGVFERAFAKDWIELFVDRLWFPVEETLSRRLTHRMRIRLPESYEVFGQGSVKRDGDGWVIANDRADLDIPLVAGKTLGIETYQQGENTVTIASARRDPGFDTVIAESIGWLLDYYNESFGFPDPQRQLSLVVRTIEGLPGYARQGYIVVGVPDETNRLSDALFRFFAHEVSHLWWSKGDPSGDENWLNESFAEFSSFIALRERMGEKAFEEGMAAKHASAKNLPPIIGIERQHPKSGAVFYGKGCSLLHRLEERIGRQTFMDFLETLVTEQVRTTVSLLECLRELCGDEVADSFEKSLNS